MIIVDENIPPNQCRLLRAWRVRSHHLGYDISPKGLQDSEIIPFLVRQRRPTFFTLDFDFYRRNLCHSRYCIVCMDVRQYESAVFIRRLLRHPELNTDAKRLGSVIRLSHAGLALWQAHGQMEKMLEWLGG
jgi:predicted nuclease of predicted toxin-antitoxin system